MINVPYFICYEILILALFSLLSLCLCLGLFQGLMHSSGPVGRHRQLVLVLEGELYLIPFALLKGSSSNEYLYERFSLIAMPSIGSLGANAKVSLLFLYSSQSFTNCNLQCNTLEKDKSHNQVHSIDVIRHAFIIAIFDLSRFLSLALRFILGVPAQHCALGAAPQRWWETLACPPQ